MGGFWMISAELLNSEATLNSFFIIEGITYVPGENLDIVIRLLHSEREIRFMAASAAVITLLFTDKTNPSVPISKVAVIVDAGDRSIWKVSLTQANTTTLSGSNIEVKYDSDGVGTIIFKTVLRNVLSKKLLSGC